MSLHLKPNPDKKVDGKPVSVPDPITGEPLPEDGKVVPKSTYWLRRLQCGDAVHVVTANTDVNEDIEKNMMSLEEAIAHCYEQGTDEFLTKSGQPDCHVLSSLTGAKVTAADRDAATPKQEG